MPAGSQGDGAPRPELRLLTPLDAPLDAPAHDPATSRSRGRRDRDVAVPRRLLLLTATGVLVLVGVLVSAVVMDWDDAPVRAPALPPSSPSQCSRFAAPSGDDDAPGSRARPLRTVVALVEQLQEGETGCLAPGRYEAEDVVLEEDGVTLRSTPGGRAVLLVETLFIAAGAHDVTVSDLDIVGGDEDVTVRAIGDRFTLTRNDITNDHRGLSCVLVGSQETSSDGGAVVGNAIHGCGQVGSTLDHGVYAQHFGPDESGRPGLLVAHNALYDHAGYAVQLYPEGEGAVVRHNVVDGAGSTRGGIVIDGDVATGHLVEGNVITRTRTSAIEQRTGSGHVARRNCFVANQSDLDGDSLEVSGNIDDEHSRYESCLDVLSAPWQRVGDLAVDTDLVPW